MTINYNVTGPERKKLVQTIAEILECDAKYLGVPSCAYQIDYFTVDKDGALSFDDRADSEEIEQLLEALCEKGFEAEVETEVTGVTISYPKKKLGEQGLENLRKLIAAKHDLFCAALGIDDLPITVDDEKVSFPWFEGEPTAEQVRAYSTFVCKLCDFAANAKRVTATEKPIENMKYSFRCFLLRIGFIGDEYKEQRRELLSKLTGSAAFKSGTKKEYAPGCDPIPTPENTVPFDVEEAKKRLKDPAVQEEIKAILNGEDEDDDEPVIKTEVVAKLTNPEKAVCR